MWARDEWERDDGIYSVMISCSLKLKEKSQRRKKTKMERRKEIEDGNERYVEVAHLSSINF